MAYLFGDYSLDPQSYELKRGEQPIAVEPQVFGVLACLIENRDRVVSKDDLIDTVWKGRIVSDATLSSRISAARRAVGDTGNAQAVIRTVARRGFRFVSPVRLSHDSDVAAAAPAAAQSIRYCTAGDGVQLAYAVAGSGPPLVKVASWLNHLEFDWESPVWRGLFRDFASYRQVIRYDSRGVGLSDRAVDDLSFNALASDLDTVIDAVDPPPFALLGISQGAAIAIRYAVRHPARVSRLILWGGFARGRKRRGSREDAAQSEAMKTLIRHGWGKDTAAFRRMFAALYLPDADDRQIAWWTEMQRMATSPENAVRLRESIDDLDVAKEVARVRTPTLILHSEREAVAPFSEARFLAARIPGAKLVPLDSANHLVLEQEPAWRRATAEIRTFLTAET